MPSSFANSASRGRRTTRRARRWHLARRIARWLVRGVQTTDCYSPSKRRRHEWKSATMSNRRLCTTSEYPKSNATRLRTCASWRPSLPRCHIGRDATRGHVVARSRCLPRNEVTICRERNGAACIELPFALGWRDVARRSPTLARKRISQPPCHVGSDATRRNTVAHVRSANVADPIGTSLPSPLFLGPWEQAGCRTQFVSCRNFPNTMRTKKITSEYPWLAAAKEMLAHFTIDYCIQSCARDPWRRAAHSMEQSWRIRASQPPRPRGPNNVRKPQTWQEAARRMKTALDCQAKQQATKGSWEHWIEHRAQIHNRYVRKDRRR